MLLLMNPDDDGDDDTEDDADGMMVFSRWPIRSAGVSTVTDLYCISS